MHSCSSTTRPRAEQAPPHSQHTTHTTDRATSLHPVPTQVHTILQDAAQQRGALPGITPLAPLLPPPLHAACRRAWVHKAWSCVTISHFQRELAQALAAMGLAPRLEYATDDGMLLVDVAVQKGRLRFAIEADGPQHFSRNPPHGPLGHSSARWVVRL